MPEPELISDEIDLLECVRFVLKRKITFLVVFLSAFAAALAFYLFSPKAYESYSIVRIGSISSPLMSKDQVMETIEELRGPINPELISAMETDVGDNKYIKIAVRSQSAPLAEENCAAITAFLVKRGNKLYKKNILFEERQIRRIEQEKDLISQSLHALNQKLAKQDAGNCGDMVQELKLYFEDKYTPIRKKIFNLKEQLLSARDFEIIKPPIVSKIVVESRINKALAILGLGLILGILAAYIREFWIRSFG
ncbi:MAG: Wzz/FepE/Etk N-terminal domain-containing protein [Candidatus Omnitrophota bacterium]